MSSSSVQEAFKGDQVDTDLGIVAPTNKAEVSSLYKLVILKWNVWFLMQCVYTLIFIPIYLIKVVYDSGASAELGNVLTPTLVQNQPKVTWPTEEGALYTVLLTGEHS